MKVTASDKPMNNPLTESHSELFLSLVKDTLPHSFNAAISSLDHHSMQSHYALWLQSGAISINNEPITQGHGLYVTATDTIAVTSVEPAVLLRFIVSTKPIGRSSKSTNEQLVCEMLFTQAISEPSTTWLFRLDQVNFPPAAVAYKHTHPGPGIRYLVEGGLTLVSDHEDKIITAGDAWFEDADSAVEARADTTIPSYFVRAMLLPLEYEGRSTFTLFNDSDANKPTLQTNTRHFEKTLSLGVAE